MIEQYFVASKWTLLKEITKEKAIYFQQWNLYHFFNFGNLEPGHKYTGLLKKLTRCAKMSKSRY